MIFEAILSVKTLIFNNLTILSKSTKLSKPRRDFLVEIMLLFLGIKGKLNFLQFGRFGKFGEQRYRQQFEKQFDFLNFNKNIILQKGSGNYVIAFDPSFVNKSGSKTYGVGMFWSGVAGAVKAGLEIGGFAAVDIVNRTAFHLVAEQTPDNETFIEKHKTLLGYYAELIIKQKDALLLISKILVLDAFFSKKPFVDKITQQTDFQMVSRLRNDSVLRYLCTEKPTGKRGRPKKFAGKIDLKNIDKSYFTLLDSNDEYTVYEAIVNSKSLEQSIKLVYVELKKVTQKKKYLLYFSTDTSLSGLEILNAYKLRFQIEFLYRDAKQHTGLNDCQARDEAKLDFHFNASLTAVNIAKFEHWLNVPAEKRGAFSMADVKTLHHNALLLQRFIDVFAVPAYKLKNNQNLKELLYFGKIAA